MATIIHDGGLIPVKTDEQTPLGKVMLGGLVVWAILGMFIAVLYANHVIITEWNQSAILPTSYGNVAGSYVSNVLYNYLGGTIVWFAGFAILGVLSWRIGAKA